MKNLSSKWCFNTKVHEKLQTKVSEECRVRKVNCLELWQCGLQTMTVTTGQRVEIDCLGELSSAYQLGCCFRVSWRFARGIITSDDSLFDGSFSGTYRCDVQDTNFRRVKRIYWGIRVLPVGVVNLDYESALARWKQDENQLQSFCSPHDKCFCCDLTHRWGSV
uniref:Transmembrane protein 81 n=1 Tax=Oryzias sinensis TaxID=183150 RepID=A0A8C7ZF79_9TELE